MVEVTAEEGGVEALNGDYVERFDVVVVSHVPFETAVSLSRGHPVAGLRPSPRGIPVVTRGKSMQFAGRWAQSLFSPV